MKRPPLPPPLSAVPAVLTLESNRPDRSKFRSTGRRARKPPSVPLRRACLSSALPYILPPPRTALPPSRADGPSSSFSASPAAEDEPSQLAGASPQHRTVEIRALLTALAAAVNAAAAAAAAAAAEQLAELAGGRAAVAAAPQPPAATGAAGEGGKRRARFLDEYKIDRAAVRLLAAQYASGLGSSGGGFAPPPPPSGPPGVAALWPAWHHSARSLCSCWLWPVWISLMGGKAVV